MNSIGEVGDEFDSLKKIFNIVFDKKCGLNKLDNRLENFVKYDFKGCFEKLLPEGVSDKRLAYNYSLLYYSRVEKLSRFVTNQCRHLRFNKNK